MAKRVFMVHGWGSSPEEGWMPWLKNELKKLGFEVHAPLMPNPDEPDIGEWKASLSRLVGKADEETFFVGHSIGCQAIIRYLESLSHQKTGGSVFIAGWFTLKGLEGPDEEKISAPWITTPIGFEKAKSVLGISLAVFSEDDPYVPLENAQTFREKLGSEIVIEKGRGHFSKEKDVAEVSEILEFFKKNSK